MSLFVIDFVKEFKFHPQMRLFGIDFVEEFKFHPKRRWRFDYANEELKIAIEQEGGVWTGGRHTRGAGFIKDMEKYNTATAMGWRVFRYTPEQLQQFDFEPEFIDFIQNEITKKRENNQKL